MDETPAAVYQARLMERLQRAGGELTLQEAFAEVDRMERLGLFLAMLELVRLRRISVSQEELLAEIRGMYREFTDNGGGTSVNLQGIRFDTKDGGVLPLDKYLAATLELRGGPERIGELASGRGLSPKYLSALWQALNATNANFLLDPIRARWRAAAPPASLPCGRRCASWRSSGRK